MTALWGSERSRSWTREPRCRSTRLRSSRRWLNCTTRMGTSTSSSRVASHRWCRRSRSQLSVLRKCRSLSPHLRLPLSRLRPSRPRRKRPGLHQERQRLHPPPHPVEVLEVEEVPRLRHPHPLQRLLGVADAVGHLLSQLGLERSLALHHSSHSREHSQHRRPSKWLRQREQPLPGPQHSQSGHNLSHNLQGVRQRRLLHKQLLPAGEVEEPVTRQGLHPLGLKPRPLR